MTLRICVACACLLSAVLTAYGDDHHGDTCEEATELAIDGGPTVGFIDPATDEDWFRFSVEAGHQYTIMLETSSHFQPYLRVYDEDCTTIVAEGTAWRPLAFVASTTGTRYLHNVSQNDRAGFYQVSVGDQGEVTDDYGNSLEFATDLPVDGTVVVGELDYSFDVDYFRLALSSQSVYALEIRPGWWLQGCVYGTLLHWDGAQQTALDMWNACPGDGWQDIRYYVATEQAGDYYLAVFSEWPAIGLYEVRATSIATTDGDIHGDTCEEASVLETGVPLTTGFIEPDTDEDWMGFTVEAGHLYQVVFERTSGLYYANRRLFGDDCETILAEPGYWDPLVFVGASSGSRYLQITGEPEHAGFYEVGVLDHGEVSDDHGNSPGSATVIPVDGPAVSGRLSYEYDADYFRVALGERRLYAIELTDHPGSMDCLWGTFLGWDGVEEDVFTSLTACGGDDWQGIVYYVGTGQAGDYYLRVAPWGPGSRWESYKVQAALLTVAGEDMHGDACEAATELVVDEPPISGFIDPGTDVDWFSFAVEAGHRYQIVGDASPNFRPIRRVYEPDCTTLLAAPAYWEPLVFGVSSTGTRYLQIAGLEEFGFYEVAVVDHGEMIDDHGNTLELATQVPVDGTVVCGEIDYPFDVDYFRFFLPDQRVYTIEARLQPGYFGCVFGVFLEWDGSSESTVDYFWACDWNQWSPILHYVGTGQGGDYYLRVDEDSIASYELRVSLVPTFPGDFEGDGDVDLEDYAMFALCLDFAGPSEPPPFDECASAFDFDNDNDVDLADYAAFCSAYSSPF